MVIPMMVSFALNYAHCERQFEETLRHGIDPGHLPHIHISELPT